jgi:hypothetical protein
VPDQNLDVARVERAVRQIEHDELAREGRAGQLAHDLAGVGCVVEPQVPQRWEIGAVKHWSQILEHREVRAVAAEPEFEPLEPWGKVGSFSRGLGARWTSAAESSLSEASGSIDRPRTV